ncbi:hypothetical protein [Mucilaginibacter sp. OK098]|uniref:hypothetical protein n=1 Tax=Mucilaginibacter sp. OK098 TaxID=1855297 RepID=UPI00091A1F4E|nr:hypothetical protein [Mucilaginibacter sp. OK098]SHN26245.1 hypothetical protein SAMN05216524_107396 [Mucilaginibacter sp. OK098]
MKPFLKKSALGVALLCMACIGISSCKKGGMPAAKASPKAYAQLLIGTFARTGVAVSNSGTAWKDLTPSYPGEILSFSPDGTYVDKEGYATDSGYWEIPPNSSTLIKGALSYSMAALDEHSLVLVLTYASPVSASDGDLYQYWRYSYGR